MGQLSVEKTYGRALFEAAKDTDKIDVILSELEQIRDLFHSEPELFELFNTPVIAGAKKKNAMEAIFKGKVSTEVLNFLFILIDKKRTRNFEKIVHQYSELIDDSEGFAAGVVLSVEALTEEQIQSFNEKTGKLLRKNVKLENRLDGSLLGGVKIFIEGKVIDASVRKRLQDLGESLKNVTL